MCSSRVAATIAAISVGAALFFPREPRRVSYEEARAVVDRRCIECHSEHPTSRAFPIAPKGVHLDTGEQMRAHAERIRVRVVVERTMPLANMTSMTDEERRVLGTWVEIGASIR